MMDMPVGSGMFGAGGGWTTGRVLSGTNTTVGGTPPRALSPPRPVVPAAPPRPPPRPAAGGEGMAKPVGTTIDGVPVMLVTDVFSAGETTTSYFSNRSQV